VHDLPKHFEDVLYGLLCPVFSLSIVDVPRKPSVEIMTVANKLILLFILMLLHQFIVLIKKLMNTSL
jgi:hypothetical protein